jgi:hypothetical protein
VKRLAILVLIAWCTGCATLDQFKGLVQPPRFSQSDQHQPELRVLRPSSDLPMGGLGVRLWAKVANPNQFGFTLPLDLSVSLSDLPGLSNIVRQATRGQPLAYRFEGTVGVDAGRLGQPIFGPMTLLTGELSAR